MVLPGSAVAEEAAARLVERINRSARLGLTLVGRFEPGETRSAHLLEDGRGGEWVLKWSVASADSEAGLGRMVRLVESLRRDGYPAPRHLTVGVADGLAYWVQERLPGTPVHLFAPSRPAGDLLAELVPRLLELVELHAGKGDLAAPPWPAWLLRTLEVGGDGYCLHETMAASADTAGMLRRIKDVASVCSGLPVRGDDIVHFDYSYANILTDGSGVTGVIDWNVPFAGALQGDRGFDVATLLFYAYDRPTIRARLWRALLDVTTPPWAAAYLAHLTLRQVEWVRRFYPGTDEHDRFVSIGRAVLDDVDVLLA